MWQILYGIRPTPRRRVPVDACVSYVISFIVIRLVAIWGYLGVRVGEALRPGPPPGQLRCWHGCLCPWHKLGRCVFVHDTEHEVETPELHGRKALRPEFAVAVHSCLPEAVPAPVPAVEEIEDLACATNELTQARMIIEELAHQVAELTRRMRELEAGPAPAPARAPQETKKKQKRLPLKRRKAKEREEDKTEFVEIHSDPGRQVVELAAEPGTE